MEIGPVKVSLQPPRRNRSHRRPGAEYASAIDGALRPGTRIVGTGQVIGSLKDPGISNPICSPFSGRFMGRLALPGERLWKGQSGRMVAKLKLG
jgi:hypothetical protein